MGYDVIDMFSNNLNLNFSYKSTGEYIKCKIEKKDVILLKPTTFMNLSGKARKFDTCEIQKHTLSIGNA